MDNELGVTLDDKGKIATINPINMLSFLKHSIGRMLGGLTVDLLIREVVLLLGETLLELTLPLFTQGLESVSRSTDELYVLGTSIP